MKVTVQRYPVLALVPAEALASHYKALGIERTATYSLFVKDRALRPELSAGEFYKIFDAATPAKLRPESVSVDFAPTHHDTLLDVPCMVTVDLETPTIARIIWEHGLSGSDPLPLSPRYIPL